jgi:uncharacterized protein
MLKRLQTLSQKQNLFLFGPRGVGKSTLLQELFPPDICLYLDLLNPETEERFAKNPSDLINIIKALPNEISHVLIDEIQKVPKLLDVIHLLIEQKQKLFVMSGSSARKLKRGAANLLAGRAIVYNLYPFSFLELGEHFDLNQSLRFGTLPTLNKLDAEKDKQQYLMSYAHTYLKEEIKGEQLVRNLDPFRRFLEVAAQCNRKIINFANIARDVGTSEHNVREYFSIIEDTLLGFFLEPFKHSFRKRLSHKPKFYLFDTGVVRSLTGMLSAPLLTGNSTYGEIFEHYIILECIRLANYFKPEYRFSYLQTKDGAEIDLVVERPGQPHLFIEIKSSNNVREEQLRSFTQLVLDFGSSGSCEAICLSTDPYAKQFKHVKVLPWQQGLKKLFSFNA